jgi:uncharacterized membrane protein
MKEPFTDTMMERLVSRTLRIGVYASSIFVLAGFTISLFHPQILLGAMDHLSLTKLITLLQPDQGFFTRILDTFLLFYLGILILMVTPILRVIMAITSFCLERDLWFVAVSTAVLFIIILGIYLSSTAG